MTKLDEIAVNVELVLISLIEGVALVTLAQQCVNVLQDPEWFRYLPYMFGGLAILLVFWAQSIMHAISFIRWPIRLEHMFLYFVSGLLQIIAYTFILHIGSWFFWWSLFSAVALGMYFLDLWIMRDSYASFAKLKGGTAFLAEVERRHLFEMKYLVPGALAFNIVIVLAVLIVPQFFENVFVYILPGIFQLAFSLYALYDCTKNFHARSMMIAELFTEKETQPPREEPRVIQIPELPKVEATLADAPQVYAPIVEEPKAEEPIMEIPESSVVEHKTPRKGRRKK